MNEKASTNAEAPCLSMYSFEKNSAGFAAAACRVLLWVGGVTPHEELKAGGRRLEPRIKV